MRAEAKEDWKHAGLTGVVFVLVLSMYIAYR